MIEISPKISFCITCMNRLEHLKKTLPINISHAFSDSENVEFILLDYNSTDGLELWIRENLMESIDNQSLKYFKTLQPSSYHRSHSRNMVFRLASGDILINLDADNFIGKGFTNFILDNIAKKNFLAVDENLSGKHFKDTLGRICVWREDFERVGGYDEKMAGYGFEDLDFKTRLKQIGLNLKPIKNNRFLKSIQHDNSLRVENESIFKNINCILIEKLEPFKSSIQILYKDYTCEKAIVVDQIFKGENAEKIETINELKQMIMVDYFAEKWNEDLDFFNLQGQQILKNDKSIDWFYPSDFRNTQEIIYLFSALKNKKTYFSNIENRGFGVNKEGFGCGEVIKNFKEIIKL